VICAGGAISNGLIPPAPGPLFVSESLKIDLGVAILGGIAFGILPALGAYGVALWMNRRMVVPVRELPGSALESLSALAARPESELPSLLASVSPVVVPVGLIASGSFLSLFRSQVSPEVAQLITFLGNKNIALFIAGILALALLAHQKRTGLRDVSKVLGPPLETAGVIILIVSAGGAYGAMIKNSGVGDAIRTFAGGNTTHYVLLAWIISAAIRVVQGSATVATITAVGIMQSVAGSEGYGVHPIYIMVAIGFGSKFLNWMNDSGFWVVNRFSGLTQGELLRSWSILISVVSLLGLAEVLLVARLFPHFLL
jgi:GntP family gluconate:H+ symporter